jgi:hypothetical protein
MQKIDFIMRYSFMLQLLILMLSAVSVQAEGLQARYLENGGRRSVLEIRIEDPPPSSVIVTQHIPPGKSIQNTLPAYTKYNEKKNVVTWLFKRPVPGVQQIVTEYVNPLLEARASSVIRCKSPSDGSLMTVHVK